MQKREKQKRQIFYKHRPDYIITILAVCLIGIGLILIYSTGWISILKQTAGASEGNTFFLMQLISLGLGFVGWYLASKFDYHIWQKYATPIFIVSILLMFLVLIPGISVSSRGASRWVRFGPVNFQPVELFKLGTVIFVSAWLTKNKNKLGKFVEGLLPLLVVVGIVAILTVLVQKDMGSSMVIILTVLAMYFISGAPWWNSALSVAIIGGGVGVLAIIAPYRLARVMTFLGKSDEASASTYHINQALIALGSGGLLGRGLGKSLQAYGYLPEATNDSIFAIVGEEVGIFGCLIIIALFGILFWRGIKISKAAPDMFGKLLSAGIIFWIGFQAMINIAAMLNLIPLTGIPLPFVSYGGTSLIVLLTVIGILQNISKYTYKEVYDEDPSSRRGNSRAHISGVGRHRVNSRA
jgi:cell division protein FtsW